MSAQINRPPNNGRTTTGISLTGSAGVSPHVNTLSDRKEHRYTGFDPLEETRKKAAQLALAMDPQAVTYALLVELNLIRVALEEGNANRSSDARVHESATRSVSSDIVLAIQSAAMRGR